MTVNDSSSTPEPPTPSTEPVAEAPKANPPARIVVEVTDQGSPAGEPRAIMMDGEVSIPLIDKLDDPARRKVRVFLKAAHDLGIEVPNRFCFSAGQVFFRDRKPEELRLTGTVLSSPERGERRAVSWTVAHWSTPQSPQLIPKEGTRFGLQPADAQRTHFSAQATVDPLQRPVIAFSWDLRSGVPEGVLDRDQPRRADWSTVLLRSVMSPVPVPRAAVKGAASLSLVRGLGRMFAGYAKVPDLDLRGKTASEEAEKLFWLRLTTYLDTLCANDEEPLCRWERRAFGPRSTLILEGLQLAHTESEWRRMTRTFNKGSGGPGLDVASPHFTSHNRLQSGQAIVETRVLLWPEESLRDADGWPIPPVRFRNEGSPGYTSLLERHGPRPYFADGWLWIPRGHEREGFRIGGLPTLLFPEGRAALEKVKHQELINYETQLNRVFRNPSLFHDEDSRVIQDLTAAIRRIKAWLRELSVYEIGHDIVLCIFEAFYRQRDAWMDQKIALHDGRLIDTTPWRIIRLDPEDLRVRLDPRHGWGPNWRGRLHQKLEALTTFERQTRSRIGRKIDVGDRFLGRVIDGRAGIEEGSAPDADPGLGLTRALKRAGAYPIDVFFVEVSVDFMERLVTWAVDDKGVVHWGIDAAKAAETAALIADPADKHEARQRGKAVREDLQTKPYFHHSPRLLTVGNLEGWPQTRKLLAYALLQEVTPNFEIVKDAKGKPRKRRHPNHLGGRHKLITIDSRNFVACNGKHDHGYRLRTWIDKAGHKKHRGPREGKQAFADFVDDLRGLHEALELCLQLKNDDRRTEEVLEALDSFKIRPSKYDTVVLHAYLPVDLENRLRDRLAEAGIDAIDEGELVPPLASTTDTDDLQPAEIQAARKRKGWSQAELARQVGVSQQMIGYWESGKKSIPADRQARLNNLLNAEDSPNSP